MVCFKTVLWLGLLLLESLLVTLALFGILLCEVWQGRVREAKEVCVIEGCVWLFWEIELMWEGICDWSSEGRHQRLVL